MEEKRNFKSGVTSTKQPRLSLIPHRGLVNAAKRFELGLENYGAKSWNGLSENQDALKDDDWLIERCSHAIEHLYSLIDFLTHKTESLGNALGDAGAVAWCGLVLGEALSAIDTSSLKENPAAGEKKDKLKDPYTYTYTCYSCQKSFAGNPPYQGVNICQECMQKQIANTDASQAGTNVCTSSKDNLFVCKECMKLCSGASRYLDTCVYCMQKNVSQEKSAL